MAIVQIYIDGDSVANIHDDYIVKTKKEQEDILRRVSQIYSQYFVEHPEDYYDDSY